MAGIKKSLDIYFRAGILLLKKLKYMSPYQKKLDLKLTKKGQDYFQKLNERGIIRINDQFHQVADYLVQEFFENEAKAKAVNKIVDDLTETLESRTNKMGLTFAAHISIKDSELIPLIFDPDILAAIHNFYGRQPFYRNQPMLQINEYVGEGENNNVDIEGKFHLDGLHQISFMLLLNDITVNDTHMQYALGSNDRVRVLDSVNRYGYTDDFIKEKYEILDLVGKKGTLYVFDAGAGYHRAVYKSGSIRKIFHSNFTPGYNLKNNRYDSWSDEELSSYSDYVRKTVEKINAN